MPTKSNEALHLRRQQTMNKKQPALKASQPVNLERTLSKMKSEREKYAARPLFDTTITDLRKDWTRR
jgi:hypothetical protein